MVGRRKSVSMSHKKLQNAMKCLKDYSESERKPFLLLVLDSNGLIQIGTKKLVEKFQASKKCKSSCKSDSWEECAVSDVNDLEIIIEENESKESETKFGKRTRSSVDGNGKNPSDDSEEESVPTAKKNRSGNIETKQKSYQSVKNPSTVANPTSNSIATSLESVPDDHILCLFCQEVLKIGVIARIHYSEHYYNANAFAAILQPKDLNESKDENGLRYSCPYDGCTKRKMGYKEVCVHMATQHQRLREIMMSDNRPGMKEILNRLYPQDDNSTPVKVKQEPGVKTPSSNSNIALPLPVQPVQVKQEPGRSLSVSSKRYVGHELDNSEDVDDPGTEESNKHFNSKPVVHKQPVNSTVATNRVVKSEAKSEPDQKFIVSKVRKLHNCLICTGPGKPTNKDARNLTLGSGLKYHYAVCVYNIGGFFPYVDHGQGNLRQDQVEERATKYRYRCAFLDCEKNKGRANKPMGYKEYAIHCGAMHHQLEKWMGKDDRPGMREVYELLKKAREEDGLEMVDIPPVLVEEMHTCLICKGEDSDGKHLSFDPDKIGSLRYHYASCYYDKGVYFSKYPPGSKNTKENGEPKDFRGKDVKYSCQETGCKMKRQMGYRDFAIHLSKDHGGLEDVMRNDTDKEVRELVNKIKK